MSHTTPLVSDANPRSRLRELPLRGRRALGFLSVVALAAYLLLLVVTYFIVTPPSALIPDLRELDGLVFVTKPISRIERLLEAEGDRIEGGSTMRPAFTVESVGWEDLLRDASEDDMNRLWQERETERQALLGWLRSGASLAEYEADDFPWRESAGASYLAAKYRVEDGPSVTRVRIRTLIADRCVTCHSEGGRHDTARFLPLDSYPQLEPRLRPEAPRVQRSWAVAPLIALFPLGFFVGLGYWHTAHPWATRAILLGLSSVGLTIAGVCWLAGRAETMFGPTLFAAAIFAALGIGIQSVATFAELFEWHNQKLINAPLQPLNGSDPL